MVAFKNIELQGRAVRDEVNGLSESRPLFSLVQPILFVFPDNFGALATHHLKSFESFLGVHGFPSRE